MWAQIPEVQIEKWMLSITIHWAEEDVFLMLKITFNCKKYITTLTFLNMLFYLGIQWLCDF